MPNKYAKKKGWTVPKQHYKLSNWPKYNDALRNRGNIECWINDDAIKNWYEPERTYEGHGAPKLFSDLAIMGPTENGAKSVIHCFFLY